MSYHESHYPTVSRVPSISLDYGTDETTGALDFTISEQGMKFTSRWQFSIGTQLAVVCAWQHPRNSEGRMTIEGIVVWCEADASAGQSGYETTLLFLELPDALKESLREFSHLLAE